MYPAVYIHGGYSKAGIGEKPLILNSVVVEFLLNLTLLAFIGLSIWLLFESWKTFLVLIGAIGVTGFIVGLLQK